MYQFFLGRVLRANLTCVDTNGFVCVQLSVEVNGTLVGDSPYLVMFEIDDDAELTTENADGTIPVASKVCFIAGSGYMNVNTQITAGELCLLT